MSPSNKYKMVIFSMAFLTMSLLIVVPTLAATAKEYPQVPIIQIMYLVALPTIFSVPASLSMGFLRKKFSSKAIAVTGMILFLISGLTIPFIEDFYMILAMRCVNGIALGINGAIHVALIAELFPPQERADVMGVRTSFYTGGGLVYSLLSGYIVQNYGWRYSYYLYAVAALALLIILAYLPSKKVAEDNQAVSATTTSSVKEPYNWGVYFILFMTFIAYACAPVIGNNMAMHITGRALGDNSMVGVALAINVGFGALVGIWFKKIASVTKRYTYAVGALTMGMGLSIVGLANSFSVVAIGQILAGFGWTVIVSQGNMLMFQNTTTLNRAMVISIMVAMGNFAQFLCPNITVPLASVLFGNTPADRFLVAGSGLLILSVIAALVDPKKAIPPNT